MNTSELIKKRRKELGLTLEEVGKRVGVSKVSVKKWEDGKVGRLKTENIAKLAEVLKVDPVDLLGDVFDTINVSNVIPGNEIVQIPIIGEIACGAPIFSEQNIVGYLPVISTDVRGGEYFALIAKGDSMSPTIQNGDKVTIRRQPTAENGDIVAVCIDDEITLKRFKKIGNQIMLMPDNREYDPIIIDSNSQSYIVGKAVSATKTF